MYIYMHVHVYMSILQPILLSLHKSFTPDSHTYNNYFNSGKLHVGRKYLPIKNCFFIVNVWKTTYI